MRNTFFATTAVSLFLAGAVVAQTDTAENNADAIPHWGQMWGENINDVFFEDETRITLRSEDEIEERWDALSEDDRELVRLDCELFDERVAEMSEEELEEHLGADLERTEVDDAEDREPGPVAAGIGTPGTGLAHTTMNEVCEVIEEF